MSIRVDRKDFVVPVARPRVLPVSTFRVTFALSETVFTMKPWPCSGNDSACPPCARTHVSPRVKMYAPTSSSVTPIAIRALKRTAVDNGGDAWKKNKKSAAPTGKTSGRHRSRACRSYRGLLSGDSGASGHCIGRFSQARRNDSVRNPEVPNA